MKTGLLGVIFLLTIITMAGSASSKPMEGEGVKAKTPIAGTLERVIDGDTFESFGHRIRLWGVDAPERGTKHYLASKLYLETVLGEVSFSCYYKDTDRYQRYVMQCFSGKEDVGSLMVRMGMAKDYEQYSKGEYAEDESFARQHKYGLWSDK